MVWMPGVDIRDSEEMLKYKNIVKIFFNKILIFFYLSFASLVEFVPLLS